MWDSLQVWFLPFLADKIHHYCWCRIAVRLERFSKVWFFFLLLLLCHCPPRSVSVTPIRVARISQRRSWQGVQGAGIQRLLSAPPPLHQPHHRYGLLWNTLTHLSPAVVTYKYLERWKVSYSLVAVWALCSNLLSATVCVRQDQFIQPSCPIIRN